MGEEIELLVSIDTKEKSVYIGNETTGAGAEYYYKNVKDLGKQITFYLETYYGNELKRNKTKNDITR